ncbi:hypothetical protein EMIT0158MI4_60171 [Burkholderia ambifaria]
MGDAQSPRTSHIIDRLTHRNSASTLRAAGWSSLAARRAHNPKVIGSNPIPATNIEARSAKASGLFDLIAAPARLIPPILLS